MQHKKQAKISSDMAKVISEIIFNEARDEILKSITITDCRVSRDLSYAKVYFTSLNDMDRKTLEKEVNEASSFIRLGVAERLNLRHTPILEFIYDETMENALKIEKIIKEIHEDE